MTAPRRTRDDGSAHLIAALAVLLFVWSHWHALQLTGFADDLALLAELARRAADRTLLADVLGKWTGPVWPGSTMWRPVPYASFALDAQLWGHTPAAWHITNVVLHVASAAFTGLLAARLVQLRLAGVAAFATMLLAPWAPEVSIWLVGRFDGWATLAIVVSLWASTKNSGRNRWFVASLLAALIAYASKESALVLPVWIVLIAWQQGALSQRRTLVAGHIALWALYLVGRSKLFDGQTLSVYASSPELGITPLFGRLLSHLAFPADLAPLAPTAAAMCAAVATLLAFRATRGAAGSVAWVGALLTLTVIAAVAVHFGASPGAGEGFRLYYLATVGVALAIAAAMKTPGKVTTALLVVFVVALGVWQSRVAAEWTRASHTIEAAARAMTTAAGTLPPSEFGIVLMPDLMGHVPVARNAQGALLALADGTSPARESFIIFTPPQLAEWHRLSAENVVSKLTARSNAPANPTRYFCVDSRRQSLEDLGYWSPGSLDDWTTRWREAIATRCPELAR